MLASVVLFHKAYLEKDSITLLALAEFHSTVQLHPLHKIQKYMSVILCLLKVSVIRRLCQAKFDYYGAIIIMSISTFSVKNENGAAQKI